MKLGFIVDSNKCDNQIFELIDWFNNEKEIDLACLIVQRKEKNSLLKLLKRRGPKYFSRIIFFKCITILESLIFQSRIGKHFNKYPIKSYFKNYLYVDVLKSPKGLEYRYKESDIDIINSFGLDLIFRAGSGILKGGILNSSKFGIISFHHADNRINRGTPPGFWEVYKKEPKTGFTIQILNEELDGGKVLYRGAFNTKFSYLLNQVHVYKKANIYMKKVIMDIKEKGLINKFENPMVYSNLLFKIPLIRQQLIYLIHLVKESFLVFLNKKTPWRYRWGVSFSFTDWNKTIMWKSNIIKNPSNRYFADPFLIRENSNIYCFIEDFNYKKNKGSIGLIILNPGKKVKYQFMGTVLEEKFHMSYPYIFKYDNNFFMVPETAQDKNIRLYESIKFPYEWKFKRFLMKNVSAVDTTIFYHENLWWMFTNIDSSNIGSFDSELFIFWSDNPISGKWFPHKLNPLIIDPLTARMGGLIINYENIIRVSQTQDFNFYGRSTKLFKIVELTKNTYKEVLIKEIKADFDLKSIGTHHFNSISGCTVFDHVKRDNIHS